MIIFLSKPNSKTDGIILCCTSGKIIRFATFYFLSQMFISYFTCPFPISNVHLLTHMFISYLTCSSHMLFPISQIHFLFHMFMSYFTCSFPISNIHFLSHMFFLDNRLLYRSSLRHFAYIQLSLITNYCLEEGTDDELPDGSSILCPEFAVPSTATLVSGISE